ncbi:hypothetical protein [Tepidibacter mesophilus]|uniref:hypothetical protein n=1 Tax=Tepidibacter mesophilus TaxID=655607 RepID=UPI000C0750E0|nr:hypothetical protein [Tepidibacter mesophilus]
MKVILYGIFDRVTEHELENLIRKTVDKFEVDNDYNLTNSEVIKKALHLNDKNKINNGLYEEKDLRNIYDLSKKLHVYEIL